MSIILIAAMDLKGFTGKADDPFFGKIPADIEHFHDITMTGDPTRMRVVIMDRVVWEKSLGGNLLPERVNVILSESGDLKVRGALVINSLAELDLFVRELTPPFFGDVFIVGGAKLYKEYLPKAERIYLTSLVGEIGGDVRFPEHETKNWEVVAHKLVAGGPTSPCDLEFVTLDRIAPSPSFR